MRTQDRFEQELEALAKRCDVDLTIDREYANVGFYTFTPRRRFDILLRLHHNWQTGSASFKAIDSGSGLFYDGPTYVQFPAIDRFPFGLDDVLDGIGVTLGADAVAAMGDRLTLVLDVAGDDPVGYVSGVIEVGDAEQRVTNVEIHAEDLTATGRPS